MKALIGMLALIISAPLSLTAPNSPSPHFEGESIPTPPQQDSPWQQPNSTLPEELLSATKVLYEQGFADPRGCEYREIEVATGNSWSRDGGGVATRGWVLPQNEMSDQTFAICWNGLVYPTVSIGESAEVSADIQAILKADQLGRKEHAEKYPDREFSRWYRIATAEMHLVSHKMLHPLKVILLLRLGEVGLAEKLWSASRIGQGQIVDQEIDPYLTLASYWTWAQFNRAICAHMQGDDRLALQSAKELVPIWNSVEKTATDRGYKHQQIGTEIQEFHLGFLEPIQLLLEDQKRRDQERQTARKTRPSSRVAELIEKLEDVRARQWSQPGWVSLNLDATVQALIAEGDDAVEPLLECLKHDERLTRSVAFHRDFFPERHLITVQEAAHSALEGILKTSFNRGAPDSRYLSVANSDDRKLIAIRIEKHWQKFKDTPIEERWYNTLQNSDAPPDQWAQAAKNISKAMRNSRSVGNPPKEGDWKIYRHRHGKDAPPQCVGEVLREKRDPSVTKLMIRRIDDLSHLDIQASNISQKLESIQQIALALDKWDSDAAAPVLEELLMTYVDWYQQIKDRSHRSNRRGRLAKFIGEVATLLGRSNSSALEKYADWIRTTDPKSLNSDVRYAFTPLWRFPEDQNIADAAEWMFNSDDSPWNPLIDYHTQYSHRNSSLDSSPLIVSSAYRRQLIRQLQDKEVVGKLVVEKSGHYKVSTQSWSTSGGSYSEDPLRLKPGEERAIRVCDVCARLLTGYEGIPMFRYYWPEAVRDETIEKIGQFMKQYGSRYREKRRSYDLSAGRPYLHFDLLEQPATRQDCNEGEAIFCLESQDEARVWQLPTSSASKEVKVVWRIPEEKHQTLKGPFIEGIPEAARKFLGDRGRVFQAEEVLEDGQWRRYFGFVGSYCVAKVPAEEICLEKWNQSGAFAFRLSPSWVEYHEDNRRVRILHVGDPLKAALQICNNRGIAQVIPQQFREIKAVDNPSMVKGVAFELHYRPASELKQFSTFSGSYDQPWKQIPLAGELSMPKSTLQRKLETGESVDLITFDLNDCFEFKRPGEYRFGIKFIPPMEGLGVTGVRSIHFTLAEEEDSQE